MLVLGALCCLQGPWGSKGLAAASIVVGLIVWGLVTSLGGPTRPGLNPARDLVPRFLHWILPVPNKGGLTLGRGLDSSSGAHHWCHRRSRDFQESFRCLISSLVTRSHSLFWRFRTLFIA